MVRLCVQISINDLCLVSLLYVLHGTFVGEWFKSFFHVFSLLTLSPSSSSLSPSFALNIHIHFIRIICLKFFHSFSRRSQKAFYAPIPKYISIKCRSSGVVFFFLSSHLFHQTQLFSKNPQIECRRVFLCHIVLYYRLIWIACSNFFSSCVIEIPQSNTLSCEKSLVSFQNFVSCRFCYCFWWWWWWRWRWQKRRRCMPHLNIPFRL